MSLIVNPSAGNVYFGVGGSVLAAQPTVETGRAIGLGSNRTHLNTVASNKTVDFYGSQVVGGNDIGGLIVGTNVVITSVASSGGRAVYTKNDHALVVGNIINVSDANLKVNGPQRVTAKTVNTFTTTKLYTSGANATLGYKLVNGNFAQTAANEYVIMLISTRLGGLSNDALLGASSYARRAINKLEAFRTYRVATAIRSGYWNIYTGEWSTKPTSADDLPDWGTDAAAVPTYAVPGELVYRDGSAVPILDDYQATTLA